MATSYDFAFVNQGKAAGQSAIGRLLGAGDWNPGMTNRDLRGIGGQRLIRKGTQQAMITGLEVFSPDLTLMGKFIRAAAGVQIAAFPDFTAGVDAGAGNEIEIWTLEDCQPARIRLACPEGGEMKATLDIWSATPSYSNTTSANSGQQAGTTIGHTDNETDVTLGLFGGAANDYDVLEWEFEVANNPIWHNPQSGKVAGVKTLPNCVMLGNEDATARIVHALPIPKAVINLTGDNWVDQLLELVIVADNTVDAEDVTFTISSLLPDGNPRRVESSSGRFAIETNLANESTVAAVAIS